jgi:hypothetical protein
MSWPSWNSDTRLPLLLLSPSFQDGMATVGMRRHGGDGGSTAREAGERTERCALDWSGRANGLVLTRSTRSGLTRHAHVESNVALDSGSTVIKMLSDQFLRNLLQPAPNLVVLCKNYQNRY